MRRLRLNSVICICMLIMSGCSKVTTGEVVEEIKNGQTFTFDELVFTPEEEGVLTSIQPESPREYYNYYQEYEGYVYYYVKGSLENTGEETKDISAYEVESETSEGRGEGKIAITNEEKSDFVEEIEAGAEVDCYFITLMKEGEENPSKFYIFSGKQEGEVWESEIQYETEE